MASDYNLHCPFDIEKHKQTYVNYLEVVICEDGTIMYAVPSHQEKGIALACARLNVSRSELDALCPREYYGDYMTWLCMVAKVVFVWNGHCVAVNPTIKQIGSLRRLKMAGLYTGTMPKDPNDTECPDCLHRLSPLTPEQKNAYLLGQWSNEEEGENNEN